MDTQTTKSYAPTATPDDINADTGLPLTVDEAADLTAKYRMEKNITHSPSHFIGVNKIHQILQTPGAIGINIYQGLSEDGEDVLIALAATKFDSDYEDILSTSLSINGATTPVNAPSILVAPRPCPPCPRVNAINTRV